MRDDIVAWERYYRRLSRLVAIGSPMEPRVAPLFNNSEPPAVTLRLLDALHPDYLLLSPSRHTALANVLVAHADRFTRVASDGGFELYAIGY